MLVHFFGDPACPWTWIASRWLDRVRPQRDLEIRWRSLSLELRDGDALSPAVPPPLREAALATRALSRRTLRVLEAARAAGDEDGVSRLRLEVGRRLFVPDRPPAPPPAGLLTDVLLDLGLANLADAADDPRWDEPILGSMAELRDIMEGEVISPTLVLEGPPRQGISGPVLTSLPAPRAGLRIWDATVALMSESAFAELHRARGVPTLPPAA